MTDKLRIGFIGVGGIAKFHLDDLAKMDDVEIAAFTDIVRERAEASAREFGGQVFDAPEQMCADAGLHAVYILLPPFAHGRAERAALAARIPFFVEKPLGLDLGVPREIAAEVEHVGLMTCVGYMNRYRASVNAARHVLTNDPPSLAHGGWVSGSPKPSTDGIAHWWIQKDKSGGQFLEQVTHSVDMLRYLCGEADEVFAYAARGFNKGSPGYTIEDASVVNIKLRSGGVANLMACTASNADGGIWLDLFAGQSACRFTGWEHSVTIKQADQEPRHIQGEPDIFAIEDRAFLTAIRTGDRSYIRSDYPDALKTLAISVAANESMATGKPVAIEI
jgi:predicted dehydrogenase